jgi:hypothetical protein
MIKWDYFTWFIGIMKCADFIWLQFDFPIIFSCHDHDQMCGSSSPWAFFDFSFVKKIMKCDIFTCVMTWGRMLILAWWNVLPWHDFTCVMSLMKCDNLPVSWAWWNVIIYLCHEHDEILAHHLCIQGHADIDYKKKTIHIASNCCNFVIYCTVLYSICTAQNNAVQ